MFVFYVFVYVFATISIIFIVLNNEYGKPYMQVCDARTSTLCQLWLHDNQTKLCFSQVGIFRNNTWLYGIHSYQPHSTRLISIDCEFVRSMKWNQFSVTISGYNKRLKNRRLWNSFIFPMKDQQRFSNKVCGRVKVEPLKMNGHHMRKQFHSASCRPYCSERSDAFSVLFQANACSILRSSMDVIM